MKKFLILFFVFCCLPVVCFAETIYLSNGQSVEGEIIEKTDRQIKIDVDGLSLTYYLDEIDRIEGGSEGYNLKDEKTSLVPLKKKNMRVTSFDSSVNSGLSNMDKKQLILKYMQVSGVRDNLIKTFADVVEQSPEETRQKVSNVLNVDDVLGQLVPIYDKYFTIDDLNGFIEFYEGPLGQKLFATAPLILKDSMQTSYEYINKRLQE